MRHFLTQQGSREWLRLRMGKPTASSFDKLITAKKHEPTKGETRRAYAIFLLTELILDEPLSGFRIYCKKPYQLVTLGVIDKMTDHTAVSRATAIRTLDHLIVGKTFVGNTIVTPRL